jgi:hypothetical protein
MQFRPHAERFMMTKTGLNARLVDLVTDNQTVAELLADGWSVSGEPAALTIQPVGASEAVLRAEGKWDTVQHRRHRFNEGSLYQPRIDVTHLSRAAGALTGSTPPVALSLLVTLRARVGENVYDAVRTTYHQLVPAVQTNVTVRVQA